MRRLPAYVLATLLLCAAPATGEDDAPAKDAIAKTDTATLVTELKAKEAHRRLAAAEAAKDNADEKLITPLSKLLTDDLYTIRKAAIVALGVRDTDGGRKKATQALAKRIAPLSKSALEQGELMHVIQAMHDLAHPAAIDALLDGIANDTPAEVVEARLLAVANVPHADAIDELIKFAARGGRKAAGRQRQLATRALTYATGERLGGDPDKWRAWWKENRGTFDFEAAAAAREEAKKKAEEREKRRGRKERRKKE